MGNSKSKADTWGGRESKNVEAPPGGVSVEPVDLETIRADNLKNKKTDDKTSKVSQEQIIGFRLGISLGWDFPVVTFFREIS